MDRQKWQARLGALVFAGILLPVAPALAQMRALNLGSGSQIGVSVRDTDEDAKGREGVVIEDVSPNSPAARAGLKSGDVVTVFDGEHVRSVRQFSRVVEETVPGHSVAVAVSRNGQPLTVNVVPEAASMGDDFGFRLLDTIRPAAPMAPRMAPRIPAPPAPPAFEYFLRPSARRLGVTLETLDEQLAAYFGVKEGVLVKSIEDGSSAARAGLKAGDVLTTVNGRQVYDASDVQRALERTDDAGNVTMQIVRDHKPQTVTGKIETAARPRTRTD